MEKINPQFNDAVQQIKKAILENQLEAAKAVNRQMLALYFGIGKFVSDNTRSNTWGTNAIETISEQLQRELPGLRGFSAASIKKMRIFYEQWSDFINRSPMANDFQLIDSSINIASQELLSLNRSPMANEMDWHDFFSLSFSHHIREADRTYVEYLLQDYSQPMGVATYSTMPEPLKRVLPNEEDLIKLLEDNKSE